jgi:hypothetical protein
MADRLHRREMIQAGLASAAALLTAEAMSEAMSEVVDVLACTPLHYSFKLRNSCADFQAASVVLVASAFGVGRADCCSLHPRAREWSSCTRPQPTCGSRQLPSAHAWFVIARKLPGS